MTTGAQLRDFSQRAQNFAPLRVLVVDDEALIRWSVSETLADNGHVVLEAADGQGALSTLMNHVPSVDVVVLDFRLPDSNDLGLLSRIRQLSPDSQVILMTAYGTPEIARGALELGAFQVVHKPFEMQDMAELIARAHASRAH